MFIIIVAVGVIILIALLLFGLQGPPFVASDDDSAAQMIEMIGKLKPHHILDMGSGNGKLVILLAAKGYKVDGIELNPLLVWRSRRSIKKVGLQDRATIKWGSFWTYDVAEYDIIVLYVIKHIMPRLEKKLQAELKPGASIISNYFVFPNLKPIKSTSRAHAYKI